MLTKSERQLIREFIDWHLPDAERPIKLIDDFEESKKKKDSIRVEDGVPMYKSFTLDL